MILEEDTFEKFGHYSGDLSPKSHKKVVAACDDCGKVRIIRKGAYRALCKSCATKGERSYRWKGGKIKQICEICGTEFSVDSFKIKHGTGKCCSPECAFKKKETSLKGKRNPNWKGGLAKQICETCGKEFPVKPSEIKDSNGRFCSPSCFHESIKGENNSQWQGGLSFEPYCSKFNFAFKEYIRDKFGRVCFLCPTTEAENGRRLSVHHVNYNKDCGCDNDETCQFVPLCISCNSKVNINREIWEKRIKNKMRNLLKGWYI